MGEDFFQQHPQHYDTARGAMREVQASNRVYDAGQNLYDYGPSTANNLLQESARPTDAPYRPGYVPPTPVSPIANDGWPVQGYRPESYRPADPYLPPINIVDLPSQYRQEFPQMANILAGEMANGRVSADMVNYCDQIWRQTMNPVLINQLLAQINTDFMRMGAPYSVTGNFVPARPGEIWPRMAIVFANARHPEAVNRIWLN